MTQTLAPHFAVLVRTLFDEIIKSLDDLSEDDLHALPVAGSTSIGFNAWHITRSADNIAHFVFYREQPVWAQQGLAEAWGLPPIEQGTGMDLADVQAMRFPSVAELRQYCVDTADAVVKKIEGMDDEFLLGTTEARIMGRIIERQRVATLGQVIVGHGNQHLAFIQLFRQMLGKDEFGT